MISVTFFASLPERSKSRKKVLDVTHEPGMTIKDILVSEGFSEDDCGFIMAMLNGRHVELDVILDDGDSIGLMVAMAGG